MFTSLSKMLSYWLAGMAAVFLGVLAVRAEIPAALVAKAHRLVLCEGPDLQIEDRWAYKLTNHIVAEGAECTALINKLANGKEAGLPGAGLGFFAYLAVLDREGQPLMSIAIRSESGIASLTRCSMYNGHVAYSLGADDLAIKKSPEFTRHVYDFLKKQDPKRIASMDAFYKKIGTSLEEMLFADGAQKVYEKSRK